jgi:uncharacterized protein YyaL (SSP411 family)
VDGLRSGFDPTWGGWGVAPKFPPAPALEFLLRRGQLEPVTKTLDGMALGGMYDVLGGGFHRYSVDAKWLVPHFEKMLYDNALLVPVYLHGWLATGNDRYRDVAERTLDAMVRDFWLPERSGFASSLVADTDSVVGLTYTWTEEDGVPAGLLEPFEHGRSILRGELTEDLRARLLELRAQRPQPGLDDKVITSWNGLALAALAEGGRLLERPDLVGRARELAAGLPQPLTRTAAGGPPFLDDYANVAHGLLELHVATGDPAQLDRARAVAVAAVATFADESRGGFFLAGGNDLVARTKPLDDHPIPSGNSMLAHVLLRIARIYGDDELERHAVGVLRLLVNGFRRAPSAFGWALCALDLHLSPRRELAILGAPDDPVARAALSGWEPNTVVAFGPAEGVPLLAGKERVDGKPTVYVCENFACRAPVTDPALLP